MNEDGLWNEERMIGFFLANDATDTINTPRGSRKSKDEIIWGPEVKGIFTVKKKTPTTLHQTWIQPKKHLHLIQTKRKSCGRLSFLELTKACGRLPNT